MIPRIWVTIWVFTWPGRNIALVFIPARKVKCNFASVSLEFLWCFDKQTKKSNIQTHLPLENHWSLGDRKCVIKITALRNFTEYLLRHHCVPIKNVINFLSMFPTEYVELRCLLFPPAQSLKSRKRTVTLLQNKSLSSHVCTVLIYEVSYSLCPFFILHSK